MNHSVNRSVNHSRRMSCAVQCPIHWGKGREGNGRENSQKIVMAEPVSNRRSADARDGDDLHLTIHEGEAR